MSVCVMLLMLGVAANTGRCQDLSEEVDTLKERVRILEKANRNLKKELAAFCRFLKENHESASEPELEELPSNCLEAKQEDPQDGIQRIMVAGQIIPVYCDQTTDGGGWTLIQRRQDGSVDFYRTWAHYENGFGNLSGEFWLGLVNIHELTTSGNYSLRVDLWDKSGTHVYAQNSWFYIDGPSDKYRLHLGRYIHGTAGDSMVNPGAAYAVVNNMAFTTYNQDNDLWPLGNCASDSHGAWWYNTCHLSDINGRYYADGRNDGSGITWKSYKNDLRSFIRTEMKIRPVNN